MKKKFKIVLTGPESTGKTSLSELLAKHYKQVHCPEYAREYISNLHRSLNIEDVQLIHDVQIQTEAILLKKTPKLLFCDTDMLNFKIWMKHVFSQSPDWIFKSLSINTYDLYLLCFPDIDWIDDGMRVNNHNRMEIYDEFLAELKSAKVNFVIIKGQEEQRFQRCIEAVDAFLLQNQMPQL